MPTNILMPALSPTMEKGNLSKWIKKEGDSIKAGDVIAEIETDKATMEVEAVDEGVLARIVVPEGTADVPVNDVIGVIAAEGEDAKAVKSAPSAPADARAVPAPLAPAAALNGSAPAPAATPTAAGQGGPRLFASPLARRIAKDAAVDLATLTGSGPHGRIVQRDRPQSRGFEACGARAGGGRRSGRGAEGRCRDAGRRQTCRRVRRHDQEIVRTGQLYRNPA
jgi:pyruvate dehydrogenase E2 component (dihydrolipoamide acetyltransferase)